MNFKKLDRYAENYLSKYSDYKEYWNYEDGCTLIGTELLYKATGDNKYFNFIKEYMDRRVGAEGKIATLNISEFNIDAINSGRALFNVYKETGDERYRRAIEEVMYQLVVHPRTKEGNFWHKGRYPYQVWLDGLYMAQPFYAMYAKEFGGEENLNDILNQFKNVKKYMYSEKKGLYYHGYDETRRMNWADGETGASPNFWARSIGWYAMALVDVIEVLDDTTHHRAELVELFEETIAGVMRYQDESGLWYQVMTYEEREGNYLETSATLMFAYSILKGVRLGVISESYREAGVKAFNATVERFMPETDSGTALTGICIMAGLNGIVPFNGDRNGSYEYYISEEVGQDDPKGVGPLFMAYSEMVLLGKNS